jgi:hypothetical protein
VLSFVCCHDNLDEILTQRRHADVWERHRRGEATDLELFSAYIAA